MIKKLFFIFLIVLFAAVAALCGIFSVFELREVFSGASPDPVHIFLLIGTIVGMLVSVGLSFMFIIKTLNLKKGEKN